MPYKGTNVNHYRGKMGQNQPLELTEQEKRELSVGLLREWWITATQALVDSIGTEAALASMNPHFVNCGLAGGMVYQHLKGLDPSDHVPILSGMSTALVAMVDADNDLLWVGEDMSMLCEVRGCSTYGTCKEACHSFCGVAVPNAHVPLEVNLIKSRAFGDKSCLWSYRYKSIQPQVDSIDRFLLSDETRMKYRPSDEILEYLALAWAGESWVIATKAFLETVGSGTTVEKLAPYMRLSGLSLGTRMANLADTSESGEGRLTTAVKLIQSLHRMKGDTISDNNTTEGEVHECPFSSSPSEMCLQYQAFFNGICEAIDPSYEFAYHSMMTKGDKTCHWTIKKKGEAGKEKHKEESPSDDPVKMLTTMYIKGEITEEEFRKKMAVLKEFKL
jgi:hypothetical protein